MFHSQPRKHHQKPHTAHIHLIGRLGTLSNTWKIDIIIQIIKLGKNKHSIDGYRPITFLNTITKLMEKVINTSLIWYLEKNKIINKEQSGFR